MVPARAFARGTSYAMNYRSFIVLWLGISVTAGCALIEPEPEDIEPIPLPPVVSSQPIAKPTVAGLLSRAHQSPPGLAGEYRLQAAGMLYEHGDLYRALTVLDQIDQDALSPTQVGRYVLLQGEISALMANGEEALAWLQKAPPGAFDNISQSDMLRISRLRADSFDLMGQYLAAATERIVNTVNLVPADQIPQVQNKLWNSLMQLPVDFLYERAQSASLPIIRGWLELAALNKSYQDDLDQQLSSVNDWRMQWPEHPANTSMPGGLAELSQMVEARPQHVYLMLPLSGNYARSVGEPIRDGFLAAYYEALKSGYDVPDLYLVDTAKAQDFSALYNHVVSMGAEFVIGPFEKKGIRQLAESGGLQVPVLALNYLNSSSETPRGLYQYGLSAEDDARSAAERAWKDGHRYAVGLAPQSAWGGRVLGAFQEHWTSLGGVMSGEGYFERNSDYKSVVGNVLDIGKSRRRAERVSQIIGQPVEVIPQRRQDADLLFLAALPTAARMIKPSLNYHQARDLPIYATSHVYTGKPGSRLDQDLNGVRFCDIPWNLSNEPSAAKAAIQSTWSKRAEAFGRLYAMGADAFQLYPRLFQLEASPDRRFYGLTGALKVNFERRVEREPTWAIMRNGSPSPYAGRSNR